MMHFWRNIYKKSFIFCNITLKSQEITVSLANTLGNFFLPFTPIVPFLFRQLHFILYIHRKAEDEIQGC